LFKTENRYHTQMSGTITSAQVQSFEQPNPGPRRKNRRRPIPVAAVAVPMVIAALANGRIGFLQWPNVRLWSTLFVSISVQAFPFLVLGVLLSGAIAAVVPSELINRLVPERPVFSVPAAGLAGMALPGCECGSVPIAGRLIRNGMQPAAALTFLLSAPAINPVVLISTAIAFPGDRSVVVARFLASFITAITIGWWWSRRDGAPLSAQMDHDDQNDDHHNHDHHNHDHHNHDHHNRGQSSRWSVFIDAAARDFVHAGGYLVVGAAAAATMQLVVPRSVLDTVARNELLSIAIMALMALMLSICSEADAFVAAGLPQFSLTSRLVFLVVGPVLDLKLLSMQAGVFGHRFARVFAPTSFLVAIISAVVIGKVVLK
jgi:uncharacterized protein